MAYSVEFYLQRYKERVERICQYEAHRRGFDTKVIHKEATAHAMNAESEYRDDQGTNGFVRWFTKLTSELCDHFKNNRDEYGAAKNGGYKPSKQSDGITEFMKEIVMGDYVKTEEPEPQKAFKICSECKQEKELSDFGRANRSPDLHKKICLTCEVAEPITSEEKPQPVMIVKKSSEKTQLVLEDEDIEGMIQIYAKKLAIHLKQSGLETERLTDQVTKWTNILNKRKAK